MRARGRFDRINRWVQPVDTADELDRKMFAAVARAETADPSAVQLKVFAALLLRADCNQTKEGNG